MNNPTPFGEDPAAAKARRGRNLAIALGLVAFVLIVYFVTVVRMGANVLDRSI